MTVEAQEVFSVSQWLASKRTGVLRFFRDSTNLGLVLLAVVVGLLGGAWAIVFRTLISWAFKVDCLARAIPAAGNRAMRWASRSTKSSS